MRRVLASFNSDGALENLHEDRADGYDKWDGKDVMIGGRWP